MNNGFSFQRPLGLVLSGGGSLGAWQAGCLHALIRAGLSFDHVLGFSSGALNGALYFLRREHELLERWQAIEDQRILRFSPSWNSRSIFSSDPIWKIVDFTRDERSIRRDAQCLFTIISLCLEDGMPVYARFSPPGQGAWDSPLSSWLVASCAIPYIFPAISIEVRGKPRHFVDGGVPGREWMRFDALAECKDIIVLEMVRSDEIGRKRWGPLARLEQKSREIVRRQMDSGIGSLRSLERSPRVFRVQPFRRLEYYELSFRSKHCVPAIEQGIADGTQFMSQCAAEPSDSRS